MKRALLLTYYMPPRPAIASLRAQHIFTALQEHGWEVIPVVPAIAGVQYAPPVHTTGVVEFRAPMRRLLGVRDGQTTHERLGVEIGSVLTHPTWQQRMLQVGHQTVNFAERRLGWLGPGVRAVSSLLAEQPVNAIISTSPPVATHLVAARAHGDIPWIADLRDPWLRCEDGGPVLRAIDELLEGYAFSSASALVAVSEPIAATLRHRYPRKRVYAAPNAFSAREWDGIAFTHPRCATLLHAGSLYGGRRDPRPLFDAVGELIERGVVDRHEIALDFYGDCDPWLQAEIDRRALGGVAVLHGRRPREAILPLERAASRLIVIVGDRRDEIGTFTGKFFEYLGARRKIIAIGGPPERTVLDDALEQSGAGERCRSTEALAKAISEAVFEWRSGRTEAVPDSAVAPFELAHFGTHYARILEESICTA